MRATALPLWSVWPFRALVAPATARRRARFFNGLMLGARIVTGYPGTRDMPLTAEHLRHHEPRIDREDLAGQR